MNERKEKILQLIVEQYIKHAEPVGSQFLVDEGSLEVSAPTVRNEMRELEEQGYLTHPHTSSGRIPTEKGYQYYVENLMGPKPLSKSIITEMEQVVEGVEEYRQRVKNIAKYIAEKVQGAIIVAFDEDTIYYTGISNMFSQPEFRDYAYAVKVSSIFDQCEERIESIYEMLESEKPSILIGEQNPFGSICGLVGGRLDEHTAFSILGPTRMDYALDHSIISYLQKGNN
jgi:heat-inducible transcriptional repressor